MENSNMDLLERYIVEVGRHLPRKGREDVLNELRSTLHDMLDDRVIEGKPTESDVEALLREYGSPRQVANSYGSEQYVIGPDLYPFFVVVAKFGLMGLCIALMVSFTVGLIGSTIGLLDLGLSVLDLIGQLITTSLSFLGSVLIVMMILQRWGIKPDIGEKEQEWNPRSLPAVDDPFRVSWAESIFTIIFTGIWIVLLNYFRAQGGIVISVTIPWEPTIIAVPPVYFVLLIVIALLELVPLVIVMRQGRRTVATRTVRLLFELAGFYVSYLVLGIIIEWIQAQPWSVEALDNAIALGYKFFPILAVFVVIGAISDIVKMLLKRNPGLTEMLSNEDNQV
jgi:hypothetical protein